MAFNLILSKLQLFGVDVFVWFPNVFLKYSVVVVQSTAFRGLGDG